MKIFQKYAIRLGYGSYAQVLLPQDLYLTNGYTISGWFKYNGCSDSTKYIYMLGINGDWKDKTINRFMFYIDGLGKIMAIPSMYSDFSYGVTLTTSGEYKDGRWHHIAFTDKNAVISLYLDGKKVNYSKQLQKFLGTAIQSDAYITYKQPYNSQYFDISFGEMRIYERALSDKEISMLYAGAHIRRGLKFWLYPNEDDITLDSSDRPISIMERVNGISVPISNLSGYDGARLEAGKDVVENKGLAFLVKV